METLKKENFLGGLLSTLESGLTNPELLLQVVLIGTVYRLANGTSLKAGEKPTKKGGEKMMKAMHATIKDMVAGEDAQNMLLLACSAAFMGFKNTAESVVAKHDTDNKAG
jgi:hypothetical protein